MDIQALLSDPVSYIKSILLILPAVLPALILHECAHGYAAYRLGDPTAKLMGRLSLNPLKHLDPLGTLCMVFIGLGWAKPVPVNPRYFRHPRRDDLIVSLSGIAANIAMFLIGCLAMMAMLLFGLRAVPQDMWYAGDFLVAIDNTLYRVSLSDAALYAMSMGEYLITPYLGRAMGIVYEIIVNFTAINLGLALFNLLPVPPLDGSHVLNDLLLKRPLFASRRTALMGQGVLLLLVWTGALSKVLNIAMSAIMSGIGHGYLVLFRFIAPL